MPMNRVTSKKTHYEKYPPRSSQEEIVKLISIVQKELAQLNLPESIKKNAENEINRVALQVNLEGLLTELWSRFIDVTQKVNIGSGARQELKDMILTRHACCLVALNGDPSQEQIAFAQLYLAIQTRE